MKAYMAILRGRLAVLFQYRAAALAGLATQLFWGIIKVMIITAFYAQAITPPPISLTQIITFIWVGQALLQLLPWNIDKEIELQVKTGNVVYDLVRPMNLYWYWFSRSVAMRVMPTLLRSFPIFILAGLFFNLTAPVSFSAGTAFGASLVLSAILSSAITTMVIISLFWTISGEGIQRLLPHTVMILSGLVVPLPLFPDWLQPFLNIQPFRCIIDIPCRLYTGVIPANEVFFYLGFQMLWIMVFVFGGLKLMACALRRVSLEGG